MTTETQIHTIARQMYEKHGPEAIAHAARNALASERRGDNEDAREWRQVEDAMKMMRGPHRKRRPGGLRLLHLPSLRANGSRRYRAR